MCLAIPARVDALLADDQALIDLDGVQKEISLALLDGVCVGDYVVVLNAQDVRLTGRKAEQKEYFRHSGYMGGERMIPFETMIKKHPERVIERAVKGMLPKNALGRQMAQKLKVYAGAEHPHAAQRPQPLDV